MAGIKQTFVTKLTDVNSTAQEVLGTLRFEGNKVYKYVNIKNTTATVAGAAGSLVGYFAATGYLNNRVVIDESDADAAVNPAGALCGTVAGVLTVDYYGWIQIRGYCILDTAVTSGAAGSPFYLLGSTTDKTGSILTAVTQAQCGVSMNTTTGVVLTCPF